MSDVRLSEDGYGLVLDFGGSEIEIGMPEANALQEQIRNALVASGCTMRQAVGYEDLGVRASSDDVGTLATAHALTTPLALLLGVRPQDIARVEPTGYSVDVVVDKNTHVNRYNRKVELP